MTVVAGNYEYRNSAYNSSRGKFLEAGDNIGPAVSTGIGLSTGAVECRVDPAGFTMCLGVPRKPLDLLLKALVRGISCCANGHTHNAQENRLSWPDGLSPWA